MSSSDLFSHHQVAVDTYQQSTQVILLRHAKTKIDLMQHPQDWILDEEGELQASALIQNPILHSINAIYSSPEIKAQMTVEPLSNYLGVPVIVIEDFREVHLDRTYGSHSEFMMMKESKFLSPTLEIGESHEDGLARFKSQLHGIQTYSKGSNVLVVSHGTIMSLYIGYINGMSNREIFEYWKKLPFCHLEEI